MNNPFRFLETLSQPFCISCNSLSHHDFCLDCALDNVYVTTSDELNEQLIIQQIEVQHMTFSAVAEHHHMSVDSVMSIYFDADPTTTQG